MTVTAPAWLFALILVVTSAGAGGAVVAFAVYHRRRPPQMGSGIYPALPAATAPQETTDHHVVRIPVSEAPTAAYAAPTLDALEHLPTCALCRQVIHPQRKKRDAE